VGFREVSVVVVREILRLWLGGHGYRSIARLALVDRKSARRYVETAIAAGLDRERGEGQLTEELLGQVVGAVPAGRPPGNRGPEWTVLLAHRAFIAERLDRGLTVLRIQGDLARHKAVEVSSRTLYRFCATECGTKAKRTTVRVNDPDPGSELQVDFGRMGLLYDPGERRRRVVHALIFTAGYSRHLFVFLTFSQALPAVIEGFEAAWAFFGGVFKVVIPDNMRTIVDRSDPTDPKLNEAFVEYAQARGFVIDPARVRHPRDKGLASHCTSWGRFGRCSARQPTTHAFDESRVPGRGRFVQPFVLVVGLVGQEQPGGMPGLDRAGMDPEPSGDLAQAQHAGAAEAIRVTGQLMRAA